LARLLRTEVARRPRVQAVLIDELAQGVLGSEMVQLAAAVLRGTQPDARLALALRLADAVDPVTLVPLAGPQTAGE
jgi:hypothetical protein